MATTNQHVVIVGAGAAGHGAAKALRQEGYAGAITLVHGEEAAPYNRTLVNEAVLPGILTPEQIALPAVEPLDVEVLTARVDKVSDEGTEVVLDDGRRLGCTAVIAATGSTPRRLTLDAEEPPWLLHMHTVEDAVRLQRLLGDDPAGIHVTMLGAGFIGAELASYLADAGADVHLVSQSALPLAPALGHEVAQRVAELHRAHVDTHFGRPLVDVQAGAEAVTVTLDDGTRLESDLAVLAHGTVPASQWVAGRNDGVPVDDRLRGIGMRGVYAAGSVAVHTASTGHQYRVDHWDAATAQGTHAARTLLHDLAAAPDPGPYHPTTGFTLNLYGQPIAAYGVPLPDARQRQHGTNNEDGVLTTFHTPGSGTLAAAAGLLAESELLALRGHLRQP